MPNLTTTRTYKDGDTLAQADLDNICNSIETFVNTTKLDSTNIQSGAIVNSNLAASSVGPSNMQSASVLLAALDPSVLAFLVPTGTINAFVSPTAPTGWLNCDGSQVSRSTYAGLFSVIGTTHGSGDGSTTFNVPDYRGRFLRGWSAGTGRDADAATRLILNTGGVTGDAVGSFQDSSYLSHSHVATDTGHAHNVPSGQSVFTGPSAVGSQTYAGSGSGATGTGHALITVNNSGGNETRPVNVNVNYIVKI